MFVVQATGPAVCITFGDQDIGGTDTARESGYTAITLHEDTKLGWVGLATSRAERWQGSDARMCSKS